MPVHRNMEVWKTTICFLLYRLAFLYSCSYLKVSSKQENQDDLNGCSLVKHHSQVSSPLKLLARRAIKVWFLFISMDTPNQLYISLNSIEYMYVTVPLGDWLEKKKFSAIIIKQQFGFPMSTT